jgi:lipopolysaccharide transport system permease protein
VIRPNLSSNPWVIASSLVRHFALVRQLVRRTVAGRYRGSVLGIAWSLVIPILMLTVYTFVFGTILNVRWHGAGEGLDGSAGGLDFAARLFAGMIVHSFFSECLVRSPDLVSGNAQYVKKVVFPLESLAWVAMSAALFQAAVSNVILVLFGWFVHGDVHATALLLPIVYAPLALLALGAIWFLSAISVFLRDVRQLIGVVTTVLLFVSPIFYPVSMLPEPFQPLLYLNPLTFIVEQARVVVLAGSLPDWHGLALYSLVALVLAWAGLAWFQKTRPGFADVL